MRSISLSAGAKGRDSGRRHAEVQDVIVIEDERMKMSLELKPVQELARLAGPNENRLIPTSTCEHILIRVDRKTCDTVGVLHEVMNTFASLRVPHCDGRIAAACDALILGRQRNNVVHTASMPDECNAQTNCEGIIERKY